VNFEPFKLEKPESPTPEPTETDDSFYSTPELSKPVEDLFVAILQSNTKERTDMAGASNTDSKGKEIDHPSTEGKLPMVKLNDPKPFTGKRDEIGKFLRDTGLHIAVNDHIYNTNIKKIAFVLSFMTEGDAASWKEEFLESKAKTPGPIDLGTYTQFLTELEEAFKPYDAPGDALEEIKTIRIGNNSAEDHVAQFKMLVTKAGLAESSMLIDAFRETLRIPLQKQILNLETQPTTLAEWYKAAIALDNKYRRIQRIIGRSNPDMNKGKKREEEPRRRWNFQKKDPNAMDIDALTVEQREEHMRKGLCFKCHKPGHRTRECTEKATTSATSSRPPTYTPKPAAPAAKKMTPKEIYTHIRSLTAAMNDDEKEELDKLAEEEGF
jgi:hypothetical protein